MDNDDREEMESHMKNLLSNQNKIEHLTRNDFVCGCHPESTAENHRGGERKLQSATRKN